MSNRPRVTDVNVFSLFLWLYFSYSGSTCVHCRTFLSKVRDGILQNFFTDNLYTITLLNEFVIILLPVLFFTLVKKLSFKEVFKLDNPGIVPMLLVIRRH